MCWVGTGHSQTRPGAFVIMIAVPHILGFKALQMKVCTESIMWASDWTVFCPCATRLIPFASFSLYELDLAYARCFQSLPLQYFAFTANMFYLQN